VGVGVCARTGMIVCAGSGTVCSATPGAPGTEVCNGLDDDCNGVVDDIAAVACSPAECRRGTTYCSGGAGPLCSNTGNEPAGTACSSITGGVCNGSGACGCPAGQSNCGGTCLATGGACTVGIGACMRSGTMVCAGSGTACSATAGTPTVEVCNGIDDNCNGEVDEGGVCIPNDRCTSATALSLGAPGTVTTVTGNTTSALHDMDGSCGSTASSPDVFYRFTLTRREIVYADAFGSDYDTVLFFSRDCGATQTAGYACNDDACGTVQSQITQVLDPGTYYLAVSGWNGRAGNFTVRLQHLPASRDVFTLIQGNNRTVSGNTSGSPNNVTSDCGGTGPDQTYYFTTCPSYGGGDFTARTCDLASWDTVLHTAQGNSTTTSCNDDNCGYTWLVIPKKQSNVSGRFSAGAGIRALYMDGYDGAAGSYSINYSIP
jgi:hypothetical protein